MSINFKRKIENKVKYEVNERLINFIVCLIGLLLVIIGIALSISDEKKELSATILISVGSSLIASAVVTYLSSLYIYKRRKEKEITDFWGLNAVFETRQRMNDSCDEYLIDIKDNLDIIAFGLRSMRDSKSHLIERAVQRGLKIRILTMHPDSGFLHQREQDEKVTLGSMSLSIIQLYKWINHLKTLSPNSDNIEIKFYDTLPHDFYFRVDDMLYVGPYLYGKDSQQTISMEFRSNAMGFEYYTRYFEELWGDSTLKKKEYILKEEKHENNSTQWHL